MKRLLLALSFLVPFLLSAQTFNPQKLDSLLNYIEQNNKAMGNIAIRHQGKLIYQKALGQADISKGIPATPQTIYRIGSISKTFTATLIMQLIENGQLSLDTSIDKFFPELNNADKITIEHLLRHQSGIYNFTSDEHYVQWMEQSISAEALLDTIKKYPSDFTPGDETAYSNSNYVLLTLILEDLTETKYAHLIHEKIVTPCGLTHTYLGKKITPKNNEALSYNKGQTWQVSTETDMSVPLGAGAIVSTPADLTKFYTCLFKDELVCESTLQTMQKIENRMGIGMFRIPFHSKKGYGHTGGIDGFQSMAAYFPEEELAIAYTGNGIAMPVNDIMIGALSIYFDQSYDFPEFTEAIAVEKDKLKAYTGTYSSEGFPLKLTISADGNQLIGQGSGQPAFPLEAYDKDKFRFEQAQLTITFLPKENRLILYQGGSEFNLTKE